MAGRRLPLVGNMTMGLRVFVNFFENENDTNPFEGKKLFGPKEKATHISDG